MPERYLVIMELTDVTRKYDRAAEHYDLSTDIVFGRLLGVERYRADTIDLLGDLRGKVVLDIGCGTGRNFPLLVPRVGRHGRVLAIDYSEGMLERARERVAREGWANVEIHRDDAAALATVGGPVDAIVSVWCLGIVHDLPAALEGAIDRLRPRGRIAIMDFDRARPDHGPLRWLYPVYSRLLRWAGIDSAEDLDDARLRRKWARGQAVLRDRLEDLHEERYLFDAGFIVAGCRPQRDVKAPA
jgi:demethylmenaquinone methyltransferase/2-methoxy-6-polyprenyl-1,4-benzoquinol methylase